MITGRSVAASRDGTICINTSSQPLSTPPKTPCPSLLPLYYYYYFCQTWTRQSPPLFQPLQCSRYRSGPYTKCIPHGISLTSPQWYFCSFLPISAQSLLTYPLSKEMSPPGSVLTSNGSGKTTNRFHLSATFVWASPHAGVNINVHMYT